jgi:predicted protein tyrosine phosphatase
MTIFLVASRARAEAFHALPGSPPYGVISITDPGQPPAALADDPARRVVHRVSFHDVDAAPDRAGDGPQIAMTPDQARAIVACVRAHPDLDRWLVHCEAGVSRSAGVAAALSLLDDQTDTPFFDSDRYRPNMTAYRMILRAGGLDWDYTA